MTVADAVVVDTTNCESEPIRFSGAVQPYGALLVVDCASGVVEAASESCSTVLGSRCEVLLGQTLAAILGTDADAALRAQPLEDRPPLHRAVVAGRHVCARASLNETGQVLVDIEADEAGPGGSEAVTLRLRQGMERLRGVDSVAGITQTAAELVRSLTGFEQVMVYRFDHDWNGEVVAEACAEGVESYLGLHYPASDIPRQARELFQACRVRLIADVGYTPSKLLARGNSAEIDLGRSALRSVSPIHIQYLKNMGATATLVGAIVVDDRLWGLISCQQKSGPRYVSQRERDAVAWLCMDLSSRLLAAQLIAARNVERDLAARRRSLIDTIRSEGIERLLHPDGNADLLGVVAADGFAVVSGTVVQTTGHAPDPATVLEICRQKSARHDGGAVFATHALHADLGMADAGDGIAGALFVGVDRHPTLMLIWFRSERARSVRWAGDPAHPHQADESGHLTPRSSFAQFLQVIRGQSAPWSTAEIESAVELRNLIDLEALREREAFAGTILNSIPEHISVLDKDGFIVTVNDPWKRFASANGAVELADGSVGLNYRDFCRAAAGKPNGEEATAAWAGIEAVLAGRLKRFTLDYPCDSPDEKRWFCMTVDPILPPGQGVIVAHQNVTERKLAELELRTGREDLMHAQRIAQLGSWRWTLATGHVVWSAEQYRIFGVVPGEFEPGYSRFLEAVHPEDRAAVIDCVEEALTGQREISRLEYRIVRPSGEVRHVRADASALQDPLGAIVELVGTVIDVTDLKAAQARAQELSEQLAEQLRVAQLGEARLRSLFDAMSEGTMLMDREGRIVDANPAAERILGQPRIRLLDHDSISRSLQAVREDGSAYPTEQHPIVRALEGRGRAIRNEIMGVNVPTAGLRWLSINAEPIYAPGVAGRPAFALATFVDITNQRRVMDSLRRAEAQQALAIRGAREGLWDWDIPTGRVYYSEAWKQQIGFTGNEIGDRLEEWQGRVHPDDLTDVMRVIHDHLEGRSTVYESEHRLRHKKGHWVWILDRGQVCERDASGAAKRMVGLHFDISERKQAQQALRQAKQELELALRAGEMGVASRNQSGQVLTWDTRMDELFAVPDELRNGGVDLEFWKSRVHPDDQEMIAKLSDEGLKSGGPVQATFRVILPDGETRYVHGAMIGTDDPSERHMIVVHRDVTPSVIADLALSEAKERAETAYRELKQHQEDLERVVAERTEELSLALRRAEKADRAKSAFLATTSHELRTPLNSIIGFSRLLVDGLMGPVNAEQHRALTVINRAGEQQLAIVKDILDYSVIESGKLNLQADEFGLRALLVEQCDAAGSYAAEQKVLIKEVDCDETIVAVADRARVGQVVRNLLGNAIKYSDAGYVLVRAKIENGRIVVEVQDSGIGIPFDQQDKLFKAFTPIEGQPGPRREKTGLGLALSRRLVEAMGGTIGMQSTPGIGSTFWFTLPLAAGARHPPR